MSIDYTEADFLFKARKVARYVYLYGPSRTLLKIKCSCHMKSTEAFDGPRWDNAVCRTPDSQARNVAIIGCGKFAFSSIVYYAGRLKPKYLHTPY